MQGLKLRVYDPLAQVGLYPRECESRCTIRKERGTRTVTIRLFMTHTISLIHRIEYEPKNEIQSHLDLQMRFTGE